MAAEISEYFIKDFGTLAPLEMETAAVGIIDAYKNRYDSGPLCIYPHTPCPSLKREG